MEKVDKIIYFFHGFTNFFLAHNITGNSKVVQNHFCSTRPLSFPYKIQALCMYHEMIFRRRLWTSEYGLVQTVSLIHF